MDHKTEYRFLETSGCLLSRKYHELSESELLAKNWGTLQTEMDQRGRTT